MSLLELLRPVVEHLERELGEQAVGGRQIATLERKMQAIEIRMDRVTAFVEAGGKASDVGSRTKHAMLSLPDPESIGRAITQAADRAKANRHDLGPWTRPPTVDRDAYAMCRHCDELVRVSIAAAMKGGDARCATERPATPVKGISESGLATPLRAVENPRSYAPKPCRTCTRPFVPSGPGALFCRQPDCAPKPAAPAKSERRRA